MDACKSTTVKNTLKASLGKTDISDIEVERFVEDSGRDAAAKAMKAAMKVAGSDPAAQEAAARAAAKEALEKSLGETLLRDDVFQRYINDGARRSVADAMKACVETATTVADKEMCASSSAKEALKASVAYGTRAPWSTIRANRARATPVDGVPR